MDIKITPLIYVSSYISLCTETELKPACLVTQTISNHILENIKIVARDIFVCLCSCVSNGVEMKLEH